MTPLPPGLVITRLAGDEEARACARLMSTSEPWITLERTYEISLQRVLDPAREVYVARMEGAFAGFVILCMVGAFVGYVQTICIHPDWRRRGLGTALLRFVEERIHRDSPNVFMCVSSFNADAQRLYTRLGYEVVGTLREYIVPGHGEILLRKTTGPLATFRPGRRPGN